MSNFAERVERELDGLAHVSVGACPTCDDCGLGDVETMDDPRYESAGEPHFSWSDCEACGSSLGGDRHPAHGVASPLVGGELIHLNICTDCLFFLAN